MAEGVDRAAWDRTATLWALQANTWAGKDSPIYTPRQIHPYYPDELPGAGSEGCRVTPDNLDALCQAVVRDYAERRRR